MFAYVHNAAEIRRDPTGLSSEIDVLDTGGAIDVLGGGPEDPIGDIVCTIVVTGGAIVYLCTRKTTRPTRKEKSTECPSWAHQYPGPTKEQTCQQWAANLLNDKYGVNMWKTGPDSEYSKLVKYCMRSKTHRPG